MSRLSVLWSPRAALLAAVGACLTLPLSAGAAPAPLPKKPKVEVVFCLDTTGSMGGLIEGAKQKIWSICNQIASGKPVPDLKVGLVAFKDKGDEYVTKVFDLTPDLDAMHGNLRKFTAGGGGDAPESVNQALDDAVNKIKWSTDKKTLRIIFLVGDAAPHMDYTDDVKYPVTCKKAVERGIIINTIQCGNDPECTKHWKEICAKAEGSFAKIAQTGGVVAIATPFDDKLAKINAKISDGTLVYGRGAMRAAGEKKLAAAKALPAPAAADRAAFGAKGGTAATYDLADAVKDKRVKLEDLKKDELPKVMQKMTLKERKEYLAKVEKERAALRKEALDLDKQRAAYIAAELKKRGGAKDSFDNQVLESLRKQAKKHGISY